MYHSEAAVFLDQSLGEDIMGQKLLGYTVPAGAACGDAIIGVSPDESALILINHCRDMKKQEARLRLITLFLLLGCAALFVYSTCAGLRQEHQPRSSGRESAGDQTAAYSKQERRCPADAEGVQSRVEATYIHLQSLGTDDSNGSYMTWSTMFGDMNYNKEKRAIVIPEAGIYFIYLRFILFSQNTVEDTANRNFSAKLHRWSESYQAITNLLDTWEGIQGSSPQFRNLFVGQLFKLEKGDHVSVNVTSGYRLIKTSFFGAFLK